MSVRIWHGLAALGDGAVLLPCALLLLSWLLIVPQMRRSGWLWLAAVLVTGGGVALSKLLYIGWGLHPPGLDFTGLSGDAALSFLFWPVAGALAADRSRSDLRVLFTVLGAGLALAITASVVVLRDHSCSEAILGALWGAVVATGFLVLMWPHSMGTSRTRRWMIASVLLLVILAFGHRLPLSRILERTVVRMSGRTSIYRRCDIDLLEHLASKKGRSLCRGGRQADVPLKMEEESV